MKPLVAALGQINVTVGALNPNADKIVRFATEAHARGARLIVFPQMALSGYPPEDLLRKRHFLEDCASTLDRLAKRLPPDATVVVGTPHGTDGSAHDAICVFNGGTGRIAAARRIQTEPEVARHPVDPRGPFAYAALDAGGALGVVQLHDADWNLESLAHHMSTQPDAAIRADLTATPYGAGLSAAREAALRVLARTGGRPLLHVNLVGAQDELVFDGGSRAIAADGRVLARARMFEEDLLFVTLPAGGGASREERLEPQPGPTEEIYRALSLGLTDYVNKNGFRKTLVALSGGIDSALVATIAVDALGADRVTGVTMPSVVTAAETRADAHQLARNLGIECLEVPIAPMFDACERALRPLWPGRGPDTTEENLQARIRGVAAMAISNKFGHLVLATGNKSEIATGYCTLYGDTVGGFALLKDVTKTRVYELARWRNGQGAAPVIPPSTIERPPTAELRHGQRDSDTLPPYEILDPILERYVERDLCVEAIIAEGFDPQVARKVIRMVDAAEYKRRQSAPGVKITPRAFSPDRRMPITNLYQERL